VLDLIFKRQLALDGVEWDAIETDEPQPTPWILVNCANAKKKSGFVEAFASEDEAVEKYGKGLRDSGFFTPTIQKCVYQFQCGELLFGVELNPTMTIQRMKMKLFGSPTGVEFSFYHPDVSGEMHESQLLLHLNPNQKITVGATRRFTIFDCEQCWQCRFTYWGLVSDLQCLIAKMSELSEICITFSMHVTDTELVPCAPSTLIRDLTDTLTVTRHSAPVAVMLIDYQPVVVFAERTVSELMKQHALGSITANGVRLNDTDKLIDMIRWNPLFIGESTDYANLSLFDTDGTEDVKLKVPVSTAYEVRELLIAFYRLENLESLKITDDGEDMSDSKPLLAGTSYDGCYPSVTYRIKPGETVTIFPLVSVQNLINKTESNGKVFFFQGFRLDPSKPIASYHIPAGETIRVSHEV
jgi:hypothetical protein